MFRAFSFLIGATAAIASLWYEFLSLVYLWRDLKVGLKLLALLALPIAAFFAPFYPLFRGGWVPAVVVFGGGIVASICFSTAFSD